MQTYTTGKIAKICDVAPRTVSKWIDKGLLSGYSIPGGKDRRVTKDALIDFLRKNRIYCKEIENELTNTALVISQDQLFVSSLKNAARVEDGFSFHFADNPFAAGFLFREITPLVVVADFVASIVDFSELINSIRALTWKFPTIVLARVAAKDKEDFKLIRSRIHETVDADSSVDYLRDRVKSLIELQNDRIRKVTLQ